MDPPLCWTCANVANVERSTVCTKYGALVLLYSSCDSYEKRVEQGVQDIGKEFLRERFPFGLNDLRS
jgi:hypothetical protein